MDVSGHVIIRNSGIKSQLIANDIQDTILNEDIKNDLDYSSLGWGDTPASVNYNGIKPYLIKATQEQQKIIEHQNILIDKFRKVNITNSLYIIYIYIMSSGSWLQFGNRMNKFKGSYFQEFADISGDLIVRNGGDAYLYSQSNLYMLGGDISMNGYVYCKGVVDLSGNSLSGSGDGGGGGLTTLSVVNVKNLNTSEFITTGGYANVGSYLIVTGTTTLNDTFAVNSTSTFSGHIDANDASFNNISFGKTELKGDIIPDTNSAYDIGSAERKIRDLYVSDASIWVGDNNKLAIDNGKITMKKRKKR